MRSETPPTKKATESSHREPWVSTTPGLSLFFAACYSVKCLSQGKFLHITERALLPTFLNRLAPIGVKVEMGLIADKNRIFPGRAGAR